MTNFVRYFTALLFCTAMTAASSQDVCTDHKVYYINNSLTTNSSTLYEVQIVGENATMVALETFTSSGHLGINADGDLYIVVASGKLVIYDPFTATYSEPLQITAGGSPLVNIPHVVVDPTDGTLYVASANTNSVYTVNPTTGEATLFLALDFDVRGGDLVFTQDGTLWLVNRENNVFYNISAGGVAGFTVSLNQINGAAILSDGTIIVANSGSSAFNLIDPSTGNVLATTIESGITFEDGDLAAGCVASQPGGGEEECYGSTALVYMPGTGNISADRGDKTKALGAPQRDNTVNFVALGFGGSLIIGLDEAGIALPGVNDLEVVETTFGNQTCESYTERAKVFVSQQFVEDASEIDDAQFVEVGESCTNGAFFDVHAATGWSFFTLVKIVDSTPMSAQLPGRDGYDVDGIVALNGCQPFPQETPGECYATEVIDYTQGTQKNGSPLANNRINPMQATGAPERTDALVFVTPGYNGSITLGFNGAVPNLAGDDLEIVETSFGNMGCAAYPEYADIYVSQDGVTFFFAKTVCKSDPFVDISDAGPFTFITQVKIVNNNILSTTFDGYDLDGVVAIHNCLEEELEGIQVFNQGMAVEADFRNASITSFPNPTNSVTQVVFSTEIEGRAVVEIIDLSGRTVQTLFNQDVNPGQEYRVDFNAGQMTNGVYIARMVTGSEVVISKIMVN